MIKNLEDIAKILGTDSKTLTDAFSKEDEIEIQLPEGTFIKNDDLEAMKVSIKKKGYDEGKEAGSEIYAKDLKKHAGIEEGTPGKSHQDVYKLISEKILADSKIEPDKKIKELQLSLENVQKHYEDDKLIWENEKSKLAKREKQSLITAKLLGEIPKELNGIKHNQVVTLLQTEYLIDIDENGNLQYSKNGSIVKDNLEKPIASNEIITTFIANNGWNKNEGGKGEGDYTGGKGGFKTIEDLYKHMESNNIDPYSDQGKKMINTFVGNEKE